MLTQIKKRRDKLTILTTDIGFKNFGYAVMRDGQPVKVGVIKTERIKKKTLRVADENARHAGVMAIKIAELVEQYKCAGLIGELPSGGALNASAMRDMGMATAITGAVTALLRIPTEFCTPNDVKMVTTGFRSATKEMVMDAIIVKFGGDKTTKEVKINKGKNKGKIQRRITYEFCGEKFPAGQFEHIADALGAYLALQNDNLVLMAG